MRIKPDHEKLSYCGRIDRRSPKEPVFVYPCTSVDMRFTGNTLKVYVRNRSAYWGNYLGCILDGRQTALALPPDGSAELEIQVEQKEKAVHELLLFKRQDACHEMTFLGVELEDGAELLDMPEQPERKIEVYGDSVSAGEVSEAVEYAGKEDPEHNGEYSNSWYSYAWMTARKLNARIHDIAQGGMALLDGTGWFHGPDYIGMETAWDKVHYHPELAETSEWDFSRYVPQVVIVALGQNDSHPEDYMKEDFDGEKARTWRTRYLSGCPDHLLHHAFKPRPGMGLRHWTRCGGAGRRESDAVHVPAKRERHAWASADSRSGGDGGRTGCLY